MGGALRGTVTGLQLPPGGVDELSPDQYAWSQASEGMRATLKDYQMTTAVYNDLIDQASHLETRKAQLTRDVETGGKDFWFYQTDTETAAQELEKVTDRLNDLKTRLNEL